MSIKVCTYCHISFEGNTSQKFCNEHRNKVCRKCKNLKEKEVSNDWRTLCRKCESERVSLYIKKKREENPDAFKSDKIRSQKREQRKRYVKANNEKIKSYYQKNKEIIKEKQKLYYYKNKEKILLNNKNWIERNKEYHKIINNQNHKIWKKKNTHIVAWRNILHRVLNQFENKKTDKTHKLLGYSANELKTHIENQFADGMSWDNYGSWHIDHIIPVFSFKKTTSVSIVNALSNLRPLWKLDNLKRPKK